MHATAHIGSQPRRRMKTWKIVVLAAAGLVLLEPILMYTMLERQKAYRESLRPSAELLVTKSAGR
jgi:hypothetical protein